MTTQWKLNPSHQSIVLTITAPVGTYITKQFIKWKITKKDVECRHDMLPPTY